MVAMNQNHTDPVGPQHRLAFHHQGQTAPADRRRPRGATAPRLWQGAPPMAADHLRGAQHLQVLRPGARAQGTCRSMLHAGEVHSIIGENGAGKSTLMNIFCGRCTRPRASSLVDGKPVHFHNPKEAQAAGIAIAPQEISLVPHLTRGREHPASAPSSAAGSAIDWAATRTEADARPRTSSTTRIDPTRQVGSLSKAQQQLVQIARAAATQAAHPDLRRADRGADQPGGREALRLHPLDAGEGPGGLLHLAPPGRDPDALRRDHLPARRRARWPARRPGRRPARRWSR